jgi:hypothetical protein
MKKIKSSKIKLPGFDVLDRKFLGKMKGGCSNGPYGDADRMCSSLCPSYSCQHDGCCTGFDWGGD